MPDRASSAGDDATLVNAVMKLARVRASLMTARAGFVTARASLMTVGAGYVSIRLEPMEMRSRLLDASASFACSRTKSVPAGARAERPHADFARSAMKPARTHASPAPARTEPARARTSLSRLRVSLARVST
ncbi:MAG TPA: hypothetical protein VFF73_23685 [Planctomycetota bacterium]|nr:hypothetical protein [Planctomycetota bacterium]